MVCYVRAFVVNIRLWPAANMWIRKEGTRERSRAFFAQTRQSFWKYRPPRYPAEGHPYLPLPLLKTPLRLLHCVFRVIQSKTEGDRTREYVFFFFCVFFVSRTVHTFPFISLRPTHPCLVRGRSGDTRVRTRSNTSFVSVRRYYVTDISRERRTYTTRDLQ